MKPIKAWHFVAENRRLGYGDGTIVAPGYVYEVPGPVRMCGWGLHASVKALDALYYAPGPVVCRVEMSGEVARGKDKIVATRREVLWMADASDTLRRFVRLRQPAANSAAHSAQNKRLHKMLMRLAP